MNKILKILISFFLFTNLSFGQEIKVFEFSEDELDNLNVRKVRGADAKTQYFTGKNDKGNYLKAVANNSASGLGKEIEINLNNTPFINITWKVEKDLKGIDERSKKGHDYAARVFVVKKTGSNTLVK